VGTRNLIIVGAGIAGLSAGFYAQLNGMRTTILESHNVPGGLCAAWKRKGYTFDSSMHMLVGSKPGPFHRLWDELGVFEDQQFIHPEGELMRVVGKTKSLSFYSDACRLEEQLVAISPEDAPLSREFMKLFAGPGFMNAATIKADELINPLDTLKMAAAILPAAGAFRKYARTTFQDFARGFKDPFLRETILFCIDPPCWSMPRYPMFALAGFLRAGFTDAGKPIGGSNRVVSRIEERYRALGGTVKYRSRVTGILVEDDRAVGVRLEDGTEQRADELVWAADGHAAIFDLLGGRYVDERIRRMFDQWTPVQPLVQVYLGVNRDLSGEPPQVIFEPAEPLEIAGESRRWLTLVNRSHDPTLAPRGKSVAEVWYPTRFDYWKVLAADPARYEEEKKRIADLTIRALDQRWPGISGDVEVADVPTPMTYARYTGSWKGSPDGWYMTVDNSMQRKPLRSLPGLSGFWMAGQWTAPYTGTVIAALTGRQLVQLMCRRDGRRFVSSRG
jgi:phytoene dehydrogenase-like protein